MTELVIAICSAVFISAVCSLLEASLYSLPLSQVEMMAQSGSSAGRILKRLRFRIDRSISAILTLNTIANTAGAAISGYYAVAILGNKWIGLFSGLFTLAILLFSEVIPKTIGVVYSPRIAKWIAHPIQLFVWFFHPIIWIMGLATRIITRKRPDMKVSAEEIIALANVSQRAGEIHADEEKAIRNILLLKKKVAREIMTPRTVVFSLSEHLTLKEARVKGGVWPHSRIPVYDKDPEDIVGLVLRMDILQALADDREDMKIADLMRPVHFVPESITADRLLREFLERRQHLFIVIDEFGGLSGVVTLEDVFEEIVGKEIVDEFDKAEDMRELARTKRREFLNRRGV
ncbi:MAG: hemolysin family protein [Candidatus Bathyarchaeia archaeon]